LRNRGHQLLVDGIHLVDVDVGDFLVLLQVEARVVTLVTGSATTSPPPNTLSDRKMLMKRSTFSGTFGLA
jgi:hypothetical protein